jgi:hypothetical protein
VVIVVVTVESTAVMSIQVVLTVTVKARNRKSVIRERGSWVGFRAPNKDKQYAHSSLAQGSSFPEVPLWRAREDTLRKKKDFSKLGTWPGKRLGNRPVGHPRRSRMLLGRERTGALASNKNPQIRERGSWVGLYLGSGDAGCCNSVVASGLSIL